MTGPDGEAEQVRGGGGEQPGRGPEGEQNGSEPGADPESLPRGELRALHVHQGTALCA